MASQAEIEALSRANKQVIDDIQSNTIDISALNATQKRQFIDTLFPTGVYIECNNTNLQVGDRVAGTKAQINRGNFFIGIVLNTALTDDSHVDFEFTT